MAGDLNGFYDPAVRRRSGDFQSVFFEFFAIVVIELVSMPVAFGYYILFSEFFGVCFGHMSARHYLAWPASEPDGASILFFLYQFFLSRHDMDHRIRGLRI